jgi:hypothetical protein
LWVAGAGVFPKQPYLSPIDSYEIGLPKASASRCCGEQSLGGSGRAAAYPDLLLRRTIDDRCADFFKESRMGFADLANLDRKSGVPEGGLQC